MLSRSKLLQNITFVGIPPEIVTTSKLCLFLYCVQIGIWGKHTLYMLIRALHDTVQPEIFTGRKLSPISLPAHWQNFYMYNVCVDFFLSCVNDFIEDTVTYTALVKTYLIFVQYNGSWA